MARNQTLHKLKLVVLDHVVSIPAIKLPVRDMVTLIRQYCHTAHDGDSSKSPFILIDGAHAWGHVPTTEISSLLQDSSTTIPADEQGISASRSSSSSSYWIDAYLSNGHKWMYSPKGSAILWIHSSRITSTFPEPTVISSANAVGRQDGHDDDDPLYHRYVYTSTKDYSAMLSIQKAMEFRQVILGGDDAIYNYVRNLARRAKKYLMTLWNTPVALAPDSMEEFMINVILPISRDDNDNNNNNIIPTFEWQRPCRNGYWNTVTCTW